MAKSEYAPFGNPDGSRAQIEDLLHDFVEFGGPYLWGGLATRDDDLTARVIVGRKGSGKTVYLRRIQAHASDRTDLYSDALDQHPPTTERVVRFCQWFSEPVLTEKWMQLWRTGIVRSLATHLLYHPVLSHHSTESASADLASLMRPFARSAHRPSSIYANVRESLMRHQTEGSMTGFLDNPVWDELEAILADILRACPPACFFVDAVDEEFKHAPLYWARCQKGLFYETMRMLRDSRLGSRLHLFICVRETVLSEVLQSEHGTRYRNEPHIRELSWTPEAIAYFLQRKLEMLDKVYLMKPAKGRTTVNEWLGCDRIRNGRGVEESVEHYIIRHTRLLPRDVVSLGNLLSNQAAAAKARGQDVLPREVIRGTVAYAARVFAQEELTICANHVASDQMPSNAAAHDYAHVYTSTDEYTRSRLDEIKEVIRQVGTDRFGHEQLQAARSSAARVLGEGTDLLSVLWQHDLVGYVRRRSGKKTAYYFSGDPLKQFQVPTDEVEYMFHPCLSHELALQLVGKAVIYPMQGRIA